MDSALRVRILGLLVFLLAAVTAAAQDGTLSGTVTDASGARVPGVAVEASNEEGIGAAVTDGEGRYVITGLTPGVYVVLSTRPGSPRWRAPASP